MSVEPSSSAVNPVVPALPTQRAPGLHTPKSSQDFGLSALGFAEESPFFSKLPFEIRRKILVDAFGGRVVHMDLTFDHPEARFSGDKIDHLGQRFIPHCNRNIAEYPTGGGPYMQLDYSEPKQWIWRSSVCHRESALAPFFGFGQSAGLNVAEDRCQFGGVKLDLCSEWRGNDLSGCFIGAMGWLQSCRQAYSEGIDVLYATNTIHSSSKQMILNLDKLLLPQRLTSLRSIQIVWEFKAFTWPSDTCGPFEDLESYHKLMGTIPTMFPNVKSLTLCLQGVLLPCKRDGGEARLMTSDQIDDLIETTIMKPIDSMAMNLGHRVEECVIAIASSLYSLLRRRALQAGWLVEQQHLGGSLDSPERHWRPLAEQDSRLKGYWVQLGRREQLKGNWSRAAAGFTFELGRKVEDEVFCMPWYAE